MLLVIIMKYNIYEITPKEMVCGIGACPSIYEGSRKLTPQKMISVTSSCPSDYESKQEEVYLVIGRIINPSESGLENLETKIGEGEALIEIPRALIDNRKK